MKIIPAPATMAFCTIVLLRPAAVAAQTDTVLNEVTVTGTREAEALATTAATVDTVSAEEIDETHPGHPSEIMNRIPGVYINVTGGEGHMTSIRQPITTKPVYLYLEDVKKLLVDCQKRERKRIVEIIDNKVSSKSGIVVKMDYELYLKIINKIKELK